MTAAHSYYQGILVHAHRTRGVTESVAIFLVVTTVALWTGERIGSWPGVVVALSAFTLGSGLQAVWLALCVRRARLHQTA
jgi:chromate transport protein ChrA